MTRLYELILGLLKWCKVVQAYNAPAGPKQFSDADALTKLEAAATAIGYAQALHAIGNDGPPMQPAWREWYFVRDVNAFYVIVVEGPPRKGVAP